MARIEGEWRVTNHITTSICTSSMDNPHHKVIHIGIMHIMAGASGLVLGTFLIWAVWGSTISVLSALSGGICSVCCLIPLLIQIYLITSGIINMIAGIGLLVTQNRKFIRLSRLAAVFAVGNIIAGDIIGLVLGLVVLLVYNDEKLSKWLDERLDEDW